MIFFDTHIHLTDFDLPLSEVWAKLQKFGIERCVCVSAKEDEWESVKKTALTYPSKVVPAFGFHPWYIAKDHSWKLQLRSFVSHFENCAIGECGFDRLRNSDTKAQKEAFDYQLDLALEFQKPLILHLVKAEDLFDSYFGKLPAKSVFHSFSGSIQMLNKIMKFGHYISVNKKFFRKNNMAEILKIVPTDRLLIETDAPFQSDVSDLEYVVNSIAKIKEINALDLAQKLYENAAEVFFHE